MSLPEGLDMLADGAPVKKKRKKPAPLSARAMRDCRARGWLVQKVEQRVPHTFITRDFLGCIDLLAITDDRRIVGIQVTGGQGGARAAHRTKIEAEPRAVAWLETGAALELWSYRKNASGRWIMTIEVAVLLSGGAIAWTEAA